MRDVSNELRDPRGRWTHTETEKKEAAAAATRALFSDEAGNRVVHLPIDVAKHYTPKNPFQPDPKELAENPKLAAQSADYRQKMASTLEKDGWGAFKNLPALEVGESGAYAVISDGRHRIWAADLAGMTHIPVVLVTGEDDVWARHYGVPVESTVKALLR